MDVILYVIGNILATLAGLLVLRAYLGQIFFVEGVRKPTYQKFLISPDLEVMLSLSAIARAYWSFSPPPVWNSDPLPLR